MANDSYRAALQERIEYWRDHSLKSGWPNLGECCDKCKMTSPRNPLQAACGCRDPFQINCECHIPVRKAFRDYMVLELEAVQKRLESNPHNGPSMPAKPTMGMWDDFCEVFKVPFDKFEQAYKAMRAGYERDLIYCPRSWTGDDGTIKDCLAKGHCGCNHSADATKGKQDA